MANIEPVRIGQYGVSHAHASGHASVLNADPDVDFVGVYEPSAAAREKARASAAYEGVVWHNSADEMLSDESIVAVAVEGHVHECLAFARECVDAGKHVWLDKPAGDDLADFQDVVAIARDRDLLVQLGYMFRYNEAFQRIFALADAGALGSIFSIRGRMSTSVGVETREQLSRHEGGILFELLGHLIDPVVTLLGRPEKITSFLRNDDGRVPKFDDNTLTVFEYENAIASLSSAAIENEPFPCRRFEVYGSKGSAIIEPLEPPSLRVCLSEAGYAYDTGAGYDGHAYEHGWQDVEVEKRPRYVDDVVAFVADIRGEKEPDRSLDHELLVQETILRASRRGVS